MTQLTPQTDPARPYRSAVSALTPSIRLPRLPASWPIWALVAGFPLAWLLGVTAVMFPVFAVPMAWQLVRLRRVRVPPGFGLWLLFLFWVAISAVALNATAPDTLPPSGFSRYIGALVRLLDYLAMTVILLYVGNASPRRVTQRSVIRSMGTLFVVTVVLGIAAVLFPRFSMRSPISYVLPASLMRSNTGTTEGVLQLSQVQSVLGYDAPRPAAPYTYTNAWGFALSLLLVWAIALFWVGTDHRRKLLLGVILLVAVVPIVYSLDRGLWIGLGLSAIYVAGRLALRGRLLAVAGVLASILLIGAILVASPLSGIVGTRLQNGDSDQVRSSLASLSLEAAEASPIVGYGSTRQTQGSASTIAVGKSADCSKCGNRQIGSTGQLWMLLISQGFVGTMLYFAFFLRVAWSYRHDRSPTGIAASLAILLSVFYSLFYPALLIPLCITMLSVALVWRNQVIRSDLDRTRGVPVTIRSSGRFEATAP